MTARYEEEIKRLQKELGEARKTINKLVMELKKEREISR